MRARCQLAASVLLLPLLGCHQGSGTELTQWSVFLDNKGLDGLITLPVHLPTFGADGNPPQQYRLTQTINVPQAWRGKELTLAFVKLAALAKLNVNGVEAQPLEQVRRGSYRPDYHQRWRITAEQSRSGSLDLELVLANTWGQSGWLDTIPRLSPTLDGGPAFTNVDGWNRITSVLGLASTLLAAIIFFAIFLFNRKRHDSGWFTVEAIGGGLYPALNLNLLQPVFGTFDVPLAGLGVALAGVAGIHMMHALLKLGRPHWIWGVALAGHLVLAIVFRSPHHSTVVAGFVGGGLMGLSALYMVVRYGMVAWRQRHRPALALSVGWLALAFIGGIDILSWMGLGGLFAGWQGAGFGIFMIAVAQAINLSWEHSQALAAADALTVKLSEQVQALKQSNNEKQRLNEELRHQVGVRSKQLVESLARTPPEGLPSQFGVGDVINERYRIEAVIGSGGMGMVYRACRLSDDRRCALKVIKHRPSGEHLARLSREAMVLSQIHHPNIIEVLDINVSQSGRLFIVMELVEGSSLDTKSERYGDVAWALPILGQMASALEAIHAKRVVHRDLKPPNILLMESDESQEQVKVADFGLAGLVDGGESSVIHLASTIDALTTTKPPQPSLTQTGAILGTPMYMAPEFVSGTKEIGPPADVFSFGVIAYEVLAGFRPFAKLPIIAAVHGHEISPSKPLEEVCPALEPDVVQLITSCLDPDPASRPVADKIHQTLTA